MNLRHITRFTYTYTNFQGWRVAINRQGTTLARYFSDKQYGSEGAARDEAIRFRDMLLDELNRNPQHTREILDKYRIQPQNPYPAGLKPGKNEQDDSEQKVAACSIRSNHVMHRILRNVCRRLQLDTASVLKLSLYMFALQYNEQNAKAEQIMTSQSEYSNALLPEGYPHHASATLRKLVSELENYARNAGMPSFEEFSTGRTGNAAPPGEEGLHNTSPPAQQSQVMQTYINPPRPSPPQHAPATPLFLSSQRLAASQPLNRNSLQGSHLPNATETGLKRAIAKKPKRLTQGSTLSNLPPPEIA